MPSVRAGLRGTAFLLALVAQAGCSGRAGHPGRIATGYISHVVCSYVFVSGLDPARVNEEDIAGNPVFRGVNWAVHQEVDRTRREVRVRVLGGFPLGKVLTHQLPVDEFQQGFDLMEAGKAGKVVLSWN